MVLVKFDFICESSDYRQQSITIQVVVYKDTQKIHIYLIDTLL